MENGNRMRVGEQGIGTLMKVAVHNQELNRKEHVKKRVKPEFARFKMKIYWRELRYGATNKNGQPMYSYDYFYKHLDGEKTRVTDEREGLTELINEAKKQRLLDNFISVVIWCCVNEGKETKHSRYELEVVKMIRHKEQVWYNPTLKFNDGKLDLQSIKFVDNHKFFGRV